MNVIKGVGPDEPMVVNEHGAKESKSSYRMDLFPPEVMFNVGKVLDEGAAKYGDNNWRGLTVETNINHALIHLYAYLAGDKQDNHLGHAVCRTMFALAISLAPTPIPVPTPTKHKHYFVYNPPDVVLCVCGEQKPIPRECSNIRHSHTRPFATFNWSDRDQTWLCSECGWIQ